MGIEVAATGASGWRRTALPRPPVTELLHGMVLFGLALLETGAIALPLSAVIVPTVWPGTLLHGATIPAYIWLWLVPAAFTEIILGRRLTTVYRRLVGRWCGLPIPSPYRPCPDLQLTEHGWYWNGYDYHKRRWLSLLQQRLRSTYADPACWRDMCWQLLAPMPAALPVLPVACALAGTAIGGWGLYHGGPVLPAVLGLASVVPALLIAYLATPWLLSAHGHSARLLLAPTERSLLRRRVQRLAETRSDAIDAQAAELRRIERDLHDGAQARLVAVGLTLGAVDQLLERDPAAARELLNRSRQASAQALAELRDLVRGIHPPVLAERGLTDALRAMALDHPMPVEVTADLPGRPAAPVEAAVYFAAAEALTNTVKHAGADTARLAVSHTGTALRLVVSDDGHGGADDSAGTGLAGIRRRLGTFDGTLDVRSPPGGPTVLTMEVPCALSSPRTSPS